MLQFFHRASPTAPGKECNYMKKLKKILLTLAVITVMTAMLIPTASAASLPGDVISVSHNGREILPGACRLINSVTYVPLRAFADQMGDFSISWTASTHTATVKNSGLSLSAPVGKLYIVANDRCFYTVEKVLNINGTVYVPIRPVAKAFGLEVGWSNSTRSVTLTGSGKNYCTSGAKFYAEDEVYWLSRIINAEAGAEPFLGKMAVGNVVLNRVADSRYPNTIYQVIFDKKYGTQFTPAANGSIYKSPNAESVLAAKICLEGYSLNSEMLFFLNPDIAENFWIVQARKFVFSIGRHDFYK